jgi:hypothetical protein
MIDIQTILSMVPAIGVIVALVYYSMTLRYTSKARQRELVFQRFQGYSLDYMKTYADALNFDWEDVEDWEDKFGRRTNPEAWSKVFYINRIYNLAGILLKEKAADADLIFQLYPANAVIRMWEKFGPVIRNSRERLKHPAFFEPYEFLYHEAKKRYPNVPPHSI